MLKTLFRNPLEFDTYILEQKIRMEKGYLTLSEREALKSMLDKNYKPIFDKEEISKGRQIITDINELRKPCLQVEKKEDVKEIIKDLKETLNRIGGLGLTANQIGYSKAISYIKIPKFINKNKEMQFNEYILINAKIIEKSTPLKVQNEQCLSFPGISVTTKRYTYITITYLDENFKELTSCSQDLEALAIQHECDHQSGIVLFDRRYRDVNYRK